jgi:hypothetical protein
MALEIFRRVKNELFDDIVWNPIKYFQKNPCDTCLVEPSCRIECRTKHEYSKVDGIMGIKRMRVFIFYMYFALLIFIYGIYGIIKDIINVISQ